MRSDSEMDLRDAFFGEVHQIARRDPAVMFLTADMGAWSLAQFRQELPDQFLNVGIAEQNMVSVAAGLALAGRRVFVYAIAPFLALRCLEQIKVDLCQMNLPVTLIGGGPGLTYASDGPTHHAIEDVSAMRALPGMTIYNPSDPASAQAAARLAHSNSGPSYVRIDKGKQPMLHAARTDWSAGALPLVDGTDILLIATGTITHTALQVAGQLRNQGIAAGVVDLFRIKPLDDASLLDVMVPYRAVVTIEEHTRIGGIGSAVCDLLADAGILRPVYRTGIDDEYCPRYGSRPWLRARYELDANALSRRLTAWFGCRAFGGQHARVNSGWREASHVA